MDESFIDPMKILLTNDDGIEATGLGLLEKSLAGFGEIVVVAPENEQSASSHSLTLRESLEVDKISKNRYSVSGTPTDCVLLAVQGILPKPPDIIISGINHGPNMGEDVTYSGTVAAAVEGTILGIPSVAISSLQRKIISLDEIGKTARAIVEIVIRNSLSRTTLINVNIPDPTISPIKGAKITKLGSRAYRNVLRPEEMGNGKVNYVIGGEDPIWKDDNGTDIAAIRQGYISVTPMQLDLTNYKVMVEMERWKFNL